MISNSYVNVYQRVSNMGVCHDLTPMADTNIFLGQQMCEEFFVGNSPMGMSQTYVNALMFTSFRVMNIYASKLFGCDNQGLIRSELESSPASQLTNQSANKLVHLSQTPAL